tara:strand:+ start:1459 stop:1818 length:360 start_codon:yes stop_codon:yes gene_type:complete
MFSEGEQVKYTKKYLVFIFACFTTWPIVGHGLQLKDLYTMSDNDRGWYMGGIYDANLSSWNDEGITSNCLEEMSFQGFMTKMAEFIQSLPEDSDSKERQLYDQMNAAAVAWLVIQKECT